MASNNLAADAPVDLQLHTIHSDGRWTPNALIDHLAGEGFAAAAITDHDNMEQVSAHLALAAAHDLTLIPAVEVTTTWRDQMVDVLCFGFDAFDEALPLRTVCRNVMSRQQANTRTVHDNLRRAGLALPDDPAALETILNTPSADQAHAFVRWLRALGYDTAERPAGKIAVEAGLEMVMTPIAQAIDAAHQSGAVCLVAHPGRDDLHPPFTAASLDRLRADTPIDGLEAYYPRHLPEQSAMFADYARRHGLLVSAGSDSHGPENPPINYPAGLCRDLFARLGVDVMPET
jgi:predicted metal-dependent phosphoesterase TrpH